MQDRYEEITLDYTETITGVEVCEDYTAYTIEGINAYCIGDEYFEGISIRKHFTFNHIN